MAALGISVNNDTVYAHNAQWLASELFFYQYISTIMVQREYVQMSMTLQELKCPTAGFCFSYSTLAVVLH